MGFQHSHQQAHKLSGMHAAMLSPKTPKHLREHLARKVQQMSNMCPTCNQPMPGDDEATEAKYGVNDNENMETTGSAAQLVKRSVGKAGVIGKSKKAPPKKMAKGHKFGKKSAAKPNPFYGG